MAPSASPDAGPDADLRADLRGDPLAQPRTDPRTGTTRPLLIGQYDSPFVRRAGISMALCGLAYDHLPWSVFGDAARLALVSPLVRVPVLVLPGGLVLPDSASILDHVDGLTGGRLWPAGEERTAARAVAALASGLADKTVALFYELRLHAEPSAVWADRCRGQIAGTLAALEVACARRSGPLWFARATGAPAQGAADDAAHDPDASAPAGPGHADIATACALRFLREVHPALFDAAAHPALAAHAARMEALEVFARISQPFVPPT